MQDTISLFIGQRVNVENIITESWQSEKKLFNGVVKGVHDSCVWVGSDERTTNNGSFAFTGGHYSTFGYIITPVNQG